MIYDLFISHSWSYGDAYDKLIKLLNARGNFIYKNYSVPKDDPIHRKIIAIEPWGSLKTSITVKQAADRIVGWNTESVVDAIKQLC